MSDFVAGQGDRFRVPPHRPADWKCIITKLNLNISGWDKKPVPLSPMVELEFLLEHLITSKTRIKLLLKFFINPNTQGYLRGLAEEFNESTNAIRVELNRLTKANLLESKTEGRTKIYQANQKHSLYTELHSIVKKFLGIDQIIEQVVKKLGNVELALITGDYARGVDSGIIDLVIVGEIDQSYLHILVEKSEALIHRKIRTLVLNSQEFANLKEKFVSERAIVVWNSEDEL